MKTFLLRSGPPYCLFAWCFALWNVVFFGLVTNSIVYYVFITHYAAQTLLTNTSPEFNTHTTEYRLYQTIFTHTCGIRLTFCFLIMYILLDYIVYTAFDMDLYALPLRQERLSHKSFWQLWHIHIFGQFSWTQGYIQTHLFHNSCIWFTRVRVCLHD